MLESFGRETAVPFLQQKGVAWGLPLHETSETYLAGVAFMVGANYILHGSTKVVAASRPQLPTLSEAGEDAIAWRGELSGCSQLWHCAVAWAPER